jgi:dihydroxyacetone kinase-like protein
MLTGTVLTSATFAAWMLEIGTAVRAEREHLTQLDAAIGDGDHGTNMVRGFDAVAEALAGQGESLLPGPLLELCGRRLVATVGGASGPLWGSALRDAGRSLGGAPEVDGPALVAALQAASDAIKRLGGAVVGDATIVDALDPAVAASREAVAAGEPPARAVGLAADAAEQGAAATIALQARKGRASYLGERSIGHQDPGATSTALILRALERAVTQPA